MGKFNELAPVFIKKGVSSKLNRKYMMPVFRECSYMTWAINAEDLNRLRRAAGMMDIDGTKECR